MWFDVNKEKSNSFSQKVKCLKSLTEFQESFLQCCIMFLEKKKQKQNKERDGGKK